MTKTRFLPTSVEPVGFLLLILLLQLDALALPAGFRDQMILAPLTRGCNLPYRRLCADFGCKVAFGEMIYARNLLKGDAVEHARLRRAPNEGGLFGVQIATNDVEEAVASLKLIKAAGQIDFVDLNCGCPINEATRRGLGSAMLRNPNRLAELVLGIVEADVGIPLTVKVRLGADNKNNVMRVSKEMRDAGAAALTIHGRTAQQRYSNAANWDEIAKVVAESRDSDMLIVGNGDILTHEDARAKIESTGVDSVMVGRGALEKPWIFQEFETGVRWNPSARDRVAVYRRLAQYNKDHFRDDARGRKMSSYFFPWHFEFLCRYHSSKNDIQSRWIDDGDMPPLDTLLACKNTFAHWRIADILWDSVGDEEAVAKLTEFAEGREFSSLLSAVIGDGGRGGGGGEELSNIPGNDKKVRKRRSMKPKRTEEVRTARKGGRTTSERVALDNSSTTRTYVFSF
jgi:tRNA-dihydrouridine synthase 3